METILNNCIFAIPFVLIAEWFFYEKKLKPALPQPENGNQKAPERVSQRNRPVETGRNAWRENEVFLHLAGIFAFAMFISAVLSVTGISPVSGFRPYVHGIVNLIPFKGVADVVSVANVNGGNPFVFTNVFGNLILLLPIGFLLPLLWKPFLKLRYTLLFGMGISLLIEFSQLFLIRATDIDDWIMNTLGALIGFAVFRGLRKTAPRFVDHCRIQGGRTGIVGLEPWLILLLCWLFPLLLQPVVSEAVWSLFY